MRKQYITPEVEIELFNFGKNGVTTFDPSDPDGGLENGDNEF